MDTVLRLFCSLWLAGLIFSNAGALQAQETCGGNLGENIFEAGDFGSGLPNILGADPGIAPGYVYSTNPPPNDGFYTITNNTGLWNLFEGWLPIQDNSPAPNGYMMVVNASFDEGIFYEQEVTGLCDNTLFEFSADIINLISQSSASLIKPNVTFLIDGEVRYTTGDIPQNNTWNTYGFTFTTAPGQTSVTLALRNNAPGGFGNDLALDNISFRACGPEAQILPEAVANICEDGSPIPLSATIVGEEYEDPAVQWQQSSNGTDWSDVAGGNTGTIMHTSLSAGVYYYRYLLASSPTNLQNAKCRIVSNTKVVVVQPKFFEVADTLCEGSQYLFGGDTLRTAGAYVDSLISSLGCDSIVTLRLSVVPDPGLALEAVVDTASCFGAADGQVQLLGVEPAFPPFQVSIGGQPQAGLPATLGGLPAGGYAVRVVDRFGCEVSDTLLVSEPEAFFVELLGDTAVKLGEEVVLEAIPSLPLAESSWEGFTDYECLSPECLRISLLPFADGMFRFAGSLADGCEVVDSIWVRVEEVRQVYLPTAFSPNDDGRNDRFVPAVVSPNVQSIGLMQVFDRWGGTVFEERDFLPQPGDAAGWDGTSRGEPLPAGVYTYRAEVIFVDGKAISYAGFVHLIR